MCVATVQAFCQEQNSVSASFIQGLKIFSTYPIPLQGTFNGVECSYYISTMYDNADWVDKLNVKSIAISGDFFNTEGVSLQGIPSRGIIGNIYTLTASINSVLYDNDNIAIIFSPGAGMSYISQDFWDNKKLELINGAHLNAAFQAKLEIEQGITPGLKLTAATMAAHYSSAGGSEPNSGINIIALEIGIRKDIDIDGPVRDARRDQFENDDSFEVTVGTGKRDEMRTGYYHGYYYDTTGQKSGSSDLWQRNISLMYRRKLSPVIGLTFGMESINYEHPFSDDNFLKTYQGSFSSYTPWVAAVTGGGTVMLGNLYIDAAIGIYVKSKFLYSEKMYWSPAATYYIVPGLGITVKTWFHSNFQKKGPYSNMEEPHYPSVGLTINSRLFAH